MKSSLTCTGGVFLSERVPKKGLGGPCGDAFSEPLVRSPADDDAPDPAPFALGVPPWNRTAPVSPAHLPPLHGPARDAPERRPTP